MRKGLPCLFAVFGLAAGMWAGFASGESGVSETPVHAPRSVKAAVIPCKGTIDDALFYSMKRRSEIALKDGAAYLIYDIDSYGGMVDAADSIAKYLIQQAARRGHTVAYITGQAISAGALISVSCQDIIMRESTTIGDSAPITSTGEKIEGVEREKAESFVRVAFQRAAEANGYPEALLMAMVTMQIEVYRVRNIKTDQYEFFTGDRRPTDANTYDVANAEKIDGSDQLLSLTAPKAQEYGIARAVVQDLDGALDFFEKRDNVVFARPPIVLEPTWSEHVVSWLNSPAVMGILIMLGLLGAYIEFSSPGFGLPGLVAVVCFALVFGSKYLVGLATWVEIVLLFIGVVLLLVEIFVLPGFGVAGILGIVCILAGLLGALIRNAPSELPWPDTVGDWSRLSTGLIAVAGGFGGFLILAWLLSRYLPKWEFMGGLILAGPGSSTGAGSQVSMTAPPDVAAVGVRIGDVGRVVSTLRPAGKARFADAVVDVVAAGEFLEKGTPVRIVEVSGSRVVVRRAE